MNQNTHLKYLALYLPQFHTIPENDKWWGKGFTEWTNVKSSESYFKGHYHPQVPHEDVGYYNLVEDDSIMEKQAKMAKKYGIYGFSYYFYWFNGKKLLQTPLENMLKNPKVEIPFCLFWANHNWTKSWDAGNQEILLEQKYSENSYKNFIDDLIPYFKDKRYIRIEGRAVLLVYQSDHMPNPKQAVNIWRSHAKEKYGEELYLITIQQNNLIPPEEFGYDAAMEGAPNFRAVASILKPKDRPKTPDDVDITFYDYLTNVFQYILRKQPNYTLFRCVYPGFDNTPRRKKKKGWLFFGATPEKFRNFLIEISKIAVKNFKKEERFVFINAWNEWAESACLEPNKKYGYKFLEICKEVKEMPEENLMKNGFGAKIFSKMKGIIKLNLQSKVYLLGFIPVPFLKLQKREKKKYKLIGITLLKIK